MKSKITVFAKQQKRSKIINPKNGDNVTSGILILCIFNLIIKIFIIAFKI